MWWSDGGGVWGKGGRRRDGGQRMMAAERGGGEDEDMRAVVAEVAAEVHRAGWVSLERVRRGGVSGKVRVCEQVARADDAVTADGKKEAFGTAPLYTRSIPHGVSSASGCVRVAELGPG